MAQVKKKMTNDEMVGLIREAMALRVKFRLKDENQKDRAKKILLLTMLCVNRHNRGGNYPNPATVLNLLIKIFTDGFNPSDANHEGVCVQEIPFKERGKTPYQSWNTTSTSASTRFSKDASKMTQRPLIRRYLTATSC